MVLVRSLSWSFAGRLLGRLLVLNYYSNNPNQIECVTLIRNLSESLKEYPDGIKAACHYCGKFFIYKESI